MSAPSPGPWRWEARLLDGADWMFVVDAAGKQVIAIPVEDVTAFVVGGLTANARLIAAAPELLRRYRQVLRLLATDPAIPPAQIAEAADFIRRIEEGP